MAWYTLKFLNRPDPNISAGRVVDEFIFEAADNAAVITAAGRVRSPTNANSAILFGPQGEAITDIRVPNA